MNKETYTREEVLEIIRKVYYEGFDAGSVEYGGENFLPEDYLLENE